MSHHPLVKGRMFHVRFNGIVGSSVIGEHQQISSAVLFDVYLCNHKEPGTNLQDIVLDGKNLTPVEFGRTVGEIKDKPLTIGCGITVTSLQVAATVAGYGHRSELPRIDLQALKAYAVKMDLAISTRSPWIAARVCYFLRDKSNLFQALSF